MPDQPGRIHGGSPRDDAIGRLLERTEAITIQHEESRRVLDGLNGTLGALRETIVRLDTTLKFVAEKADDHATKLADYENVKARVTACESDLKRWADIRNQVIRYSIILTLLAITSGTVGGTLLRAALGIH